MFKELINEAQITLKLEVDSPLMIGAGENNVIDPSLPDNQVIRRLKNGKLEPFIPGSSLKGVFRSRAEQLLSSMGYEIDFTYKSKKLIGTGKEIYQKSCPASKLFGSLDIKSRIYFTDAQVVEGTEVAFGIRNNVAIDRVTGGSKGSALFDIEVIESATFETKITLTNFELYQLAVILSLIKDLDDGYMRLGASTSRGFGKMKVHVKNVQIRSYYERKQEDHIVGMLFKDKDKTVEKVKWKKDIFGWVYENNNLEEWIGEKGYLTKGVRWPNK